ncbi:MAG TPA: hypothetical protein VG389_03305, partial [Myxococcota bacterium]|nr:hypothetical protein [Myxococcota bacterium]
GPFVLAYNLGRVAVGGLKRHGYASATLGEPLSVRAWLAARRAAGEDVLALPPAQRKARVAELADELMRRIGAVVPVTPVPLVAEALLRERAEAGEDAARRPVTRAALVKRVATLTALALQRGAPVIRGDEFAETAGVRARLADARDEGARRPELLDVEESLVRADEARTATRLGLEILVRRGLVEAVGQGDSQTLRVMPEALPYVRYYANSVRQHFDAR